MRIIPVGGFLFIVGLVFLGTALLLLGGLREQVGAPSIPLAFGVHIPSFFRIPLVLVLVCAGVYCIWYELRFLWRDRNVITLVLELGILFYLGYVAVFDFLR